MRAATMPGTFGEVFNLGHSEVLPLSEIARLTMSAAGTDSKVRCVPWPDDVRRIDIGSFEGDFSKARRVSDGTPGFSSRTESRRRSLTTGRSRESRSSISRGGSHDSSRSTLMRSAV